MGIALCHMTTNLALAILLQRARQQNDALARVFENTASRKIMLGSENFRWRHERHLVAIFDGNDGGLERYDRFAGPDVPLQQTSHGTRFFHVRRNFLKYTFLGGSGVEGQYLLDGITRPIIQLEGDARAGFLLAALKLEPEFDEEQFFEYQPDVSGRSRRLQIFETLAGVWPVRLPECFTRRDETHARANRGGDWIRKIWSQVF